MMFFQPGALHRPQPTALPWLGIETVTFMPLFPGDGGGCQRPLLQGALSTQQGLPA